MSIHCTEVTVTTALTQNVRILYDVGYELEWCSWRLYR